MKFLAILLHIIRRGFDKILMYIMRYSFKSYGKNFHFDPYGVYSFRTIEVGNDVFIGPGATLSASESGIKFGNKIMLGPNVTMMGGDHNASIIGKYMYDVKYKLPENDLPIIIEDDVWIGCNAIILKGVTIGEGSIVAAGALVNKNVPPYTIVGGIPAKILKKRFEEDDLKKHINLIKAEIKSDL